jgi:hypothetical protein
MISRATSSESSRSSWFVGALPEVLLGRGEAPLFPMRGVGDVISSWVSETAEATEYINAEEKGRAGKEKPTTFVRRRPLNGRSIILLFLVDLEQHPILFF